MKMVLKILSVIPLLYLMIIPLFLAGFTSSRPCGGVEVSIKDSSDLHFVTKRQLLNLAYGNSGRISGKPVRDVSISEIESRINILKELKVAEAYITVDGTIHIYADQRNPIMRLMPDEGGDYFVDEDGVVVRRRNLYTPHLHIVGGNINISKTMLDGVSVLDTSIKNTILKDIYHIVNYINDDKFWSAQIDQLYVDSNNEIDMIPRVGNQVIHLGTAENLEGKLRNLEAFYEKVLPEIGWNKYSLINLEFKDQIVCKKR
jgi:cell division protein FtsQ